MSYITFTPNTDMPLEPPSAWLGTTAENSAATSSSSSIDLKNEKTAARVTETTSGSGLSARGVDDTAGLEDDDDADRPLPPKQGSRAYRYLRWNFGSVYRRIFTLAFLGNMAVLAVLGGRALAGYRAMTYIGAADAVAANLLAALVVRNEHVVNVLFRVFANPRLAKTAPLRLRHLLAKVYSYGGLHSGCAVAATFWYVLFLALQWLEYTGNGQLSVNAGRAVWTPLRIAAMVFSVGILALLVLIVAFAHPRARVLHHNYFENVHRFLGWSVVVFFWAEVLLLVGDVAQTSAAAYGPVLVRQPTFWMVASITALVVYPWTRLRERSVVAEPLSDHCIKLNFDYRPAHFGMAVRLSDSPLTETHAFATIPNAAPVSDADLERGVPPPALSNAGRPGFSVVISNAGDWTRKIIQNPPTRMYTRGVPQYGVMRVAGMFEPCIVMATGSGIAPCLSLFVEKPSHPVRIIWSTPRPLLTFGQGIIDAVYAADPHAIIHDTKKDGRPDLVKMAYDMWRDSRRASPHSAAMHGKNAGACEAVVIISNQKVTRKVVYGLESRGVHAYGALFDS